MCTSGEWICIQPEDCMRVFGAYLPERMDIGKRVLSKQSNTPNKLHHVWSLRWFRYLSAWQAWLLLHSLLLPLPPPPTLPFLVSLLLFFCFTFSSFLLQMQIVLQKFIYFLLYNLYLHTSKRILKPQQWYVLRSWHEPPFLQPRTEERRTLML